MANGLHKYTVQEGVNLQLGQAGFDVIAAATNGAQTGNWVAIYNSSDSVANIDATCAVGDNLVDFQLLSGDIIYGNFTSVTCDTSDVIVLYRG